MPHPDIAEALGISPPQAQPESGRGCPEACEQNPRTRRQGPSRSAGDLREGQTWTEWGRPIREGPDRPQDWETSTGATRSSARRTWTRPRAGYR